MKSQAKYGERDYALQKELEQMQEEQSITVPAWVGWLIAALLISIAVLAVVFAPNLGTA